MEDGGEDSSEDGAGRDGGAYGGTSEKILFQRSHKIFSLVPPSPTVLPAFGWAQNFLPPCFF